MNYNELSDKDKVRLILQHVMGCWVTDVTAQGYHDPELPKGRELAALGFHWPLAYWNTDCECWMMRDIATEPTEFDPLHDLNDAWKIVEHMDALVKIRYAPREPVCCTISFFPHDQFFFGLENTSPGAICTAALCAKAVLDAKGNVIEASK